MPQTFQQFLEILEYNYFDISIKNYLICFCILVIFYIFKRVFSKIILAFLHSLAKKTATDADDKIINALDAPFQFSFVILGLFFAKKSLQLPYDTPLFDSFLQSLVVLVIFWSLYELVKEFNQLIGFFSSKMCEPLDMDVENFVVKTLKVVIFIIGFLMILQSWGVNITAFIASLGLGGLAFALAAKDTAANLFGSLVILADRPFNVGDWVEINGKEGVVEEIGIRSTRIRTFGQSQVTIPNAIVANTSISNWTRMGKRRIKESLGLTYDTTSKQLEDIMAQMQTYLTQNEHIHDDGVVVSFTEFGGSSLNILYQYFTKTTTYKEYLKIKESANFAFMKIVEQNGSSFAFPSQSIYVETLPKENK